MVVIDHYSSRSRRLDPQLDSDKKVECITATLSPVSEGMLMPSQGGYEKFFHGCPMIGAHAMDPAVGCYFWNSSAITPSALANFSFRRLSADAKKRSSN
jgi:hypothetical protein